MAELLTRELPGTGGAFKERPEDFGVEEIPLYEACGSGEHLYLEVEKRGLTTFAMLQKIALALGVREREIGYAGLKDARATTRQLISVPRTDPERALALDLEGIRVLSARRHGNKLRLGHLAGNRFRIRLRGVSEQAEGRAAAILKVLEQKGVPNFFGEQRYGALANSHRIGAALLRRDYQQALAELIGDPAEITNERWRQGAERFHAGDLAGALEALPGRMRDERSLIHRLREGHSAEQAILSLPRKLLRLYLSAFQSDLFDRLVACRLPELGRLERGDLAYLHRNGACFLVADACAEQPRAERFEISPTAPLFGFKTALAEGAPGERERQLLEGLNLTPEDFRLPGGLKMEGERRPLRVPLSEPRIERQGADLLLGFVLPKGCYATSVLREVMKNT